MVADSKPWADGPFKLISAKHGGFEGIDPNKPRKGLDQTIWEMVAIHNVFIRGLNAIHNQAVKVGTQGTEEDKTDFFEFAAIWAFGLHEHHALEETKIFPDIEEVTGVKGVMEANVHQHEAFTEGITQYQEYLKSVRSGAEVYDGHKLLAIIDSFGPTLAEHLLDEIETLKSLRQYSDADFELVQKRLEKYIQDNVQKGDDMTKWYSFVVSNHDKQFEKGELRTFPLIPWFIKLMLNWLYVPSFKHLWRFSSCTLSGKRQELPLA